MRNKKVTGEVRVAIEFLKYLPKVWTQELTGVINNILREDDLISRLGSS